MDKLPPFNRDGLRVAPYYCGDSDKPAWRVDVKTHKWQEGVDFAPDAFADDALVGEALEQLNRQIARKSTPSPASPITLEAVRALANG